MSPATCHLSPTYDADGNQTLVTTSTGRWRVTYNSENRPVRWELVSPNSNTPNSNTQTLLLMSYDRMGRRRTKNDQRFVYNGYLQIANHHSSTSTSHFNYYLWDPTEPIATRPLAWKRGTFAAYYVFDGDKNVSEVVAADNDVAAHYEYAPFGAVILRRGESAAIKARTRLISVFPNQAFQLRLVSAICMEISDEWEAGMIYLNVNEL